MIICVCISALGISVRLGSFRSSALSTALSLNQLSPQTNFTAANLSEDRHAVIFRSIRALQIQCCVSEKDEIQKYKTKYPLGGEKTFIFCFS